MDRLRTCSQETLRSWRSGGTFSVRTRAPSSLSATLQALMSISWRLIRWLSRISKRRSSIWTQMLRFQCWRMGTRKSLAMGSPFTTIWSTRANKCPHISSTRPSLERSTRSWHISCARFAESLANWSKLSPIRRFSDRNEELMTRESGNTSVSSLTWSWQNLMHTWSREAT